MEEKGVYKIIRQPQCGKITKYLSPMICALALQ